MLRYVNKFIYDPGGMLTFLVSCFYNAFIFNCYNFGDALKVNKFNLMIALVLLDGDFYCIIPMSVIELVFMLSYLLVWLL